MSKLQLAATVLAASTLVGAVAEASQKVVVWHSYRGKERSALEKVAAGFNGRQKELQIELLPIPYDAFPDKVTAAIPRDKGPDLFIFAQDRIGDWAAASLIEPVDFWVGDELRGAYLEPTVEALTYGGSLYALPMAFKMVTLFYNEKLVPKPPTTTDELVELAKKLTDPKAGRYGLVYENADFYFHGAWLNGFGGRVFDKKRNPTLDTPEVVESMLFARYLANEAGIMPEEVSSALVTSLFNQGKAAMVINGPWFLGEIDPKVSARVALLPTISKVNQRARPFLTAEGVIMSAKAKDKKAAFEVMKHLTSPEAGLVMALEGRQTSARREVYEDAKVKKDPILSVFKEQLQYAVPMPNTPAMRMVWQPATSAMNKVIKGKADPKPVMTETQAQVVKLVKDARR